MSDLIRTSAELESACAHARADGILALDTEFVWKSTYRPILGIVQMGARAACWAIDCLTGLDTVPLRALVEDESVVKILHDARQDLAHLHHWTGAVPANVFDTQLAAAFAGFPQGIGLQKLLEDAIDIGLPKSETLTDWTQRPLTPAQVAYALDDVRYLPALKDELVRRASELGTLEWMFEDQLRYDDPALYDESDTSVVWRKIRLGRTRLNTRQRAILRAIAAVREETARSWNLPRNWLGDDGSLVGMALKGHADHFVHRLKGGKGDTLRALYREAIGAALQVPEADCPPEAARYYIPEVRDAADQALRWLAERAEQLHVAPGAIASRATVTAFVDDVGDESNPLASGWRYEQVGAEMAERFGVA